MESRQLEILRAIVEEYVATEEPVGSKSIAERHGIGVSAATIRNEMAILEEEGLITQPHTSAGRIPTDKGYRLFVDRIATVKPLSKPERRAIETFLEGANDLDDVIMRTVRLLAQVTKQVAVVQYPSLTKS
ncbi:MAG: heat-inducible transcriptional repressor HrcA, partial [Actinobacteria bacterium]|nr:heat-inducible transcriptional repressor HrcA [Actinomycetota bacterium]